MSVTWIVVADSAKARILKAESPAAPLTEIDVVDHPEGRLQNHEINSDRAGRGHNATASGSANMEPKVDPSKQEAMKFAKSLGEYIDQAEQNQSFDRLVLSAPPVFLGLLRDNLHKNTQDRVVRTLDKNLVQSELSDIRAHVPELF